MELNERMSQLLAYANTTPAAFSRLIGCKTPQAVREIIKGNTKSISTTMRDNILYCFPEVSRDWLLYGEGEMLLNNDKKEGSDEQNKTAKSVKLDKNLSKNQLVLSNEIVKEIVAEVSAWRGMIQKQFDCSQTTIDRLLTILENTSKH